MKCNFGVRETYSRIYIYIYIPGRRKEIIRFKTDKISKNIFVYLYLIIIKIKIKVLFGLLPGHLLHLEGFEADV